MTQSFEDVVSATPWRTHLLIATVDGCRMWALSNGDIEWVIPDHFTDEDLYRLSAWVTASAEARRSGKESPAYDARADAPRVPLTVDEVAGMVGFPPDGVKLHELINNYGGEDDDH